MPTSLVTGGAGFLGSHVANELLAMNHSVVIVDDLSGGFISNIPRQAIFIEGSILDEELIEELFAQYKFDYVYHLAAYAAEGLSHFIKNFNYRNNLIGSSNLINASINHAVKCFVFTSSIAVYGNQPPPMSEEMLPTPEDPYGIAKYAVELDLQSSLRQFGLNHIIFRPHNVYGPQQNIGDRYRNVIGIFMNQILKNEPLTIFGDGSQTRAFSYIDDVAPYIARSVEIKEAYNQRFNIGSNDIHSLNELADFVSKAMNSETSISYLSKRNEVTHAVANHDKFEKTFSVRNPITLEEGLSKMAKWVQVVGSIPTSKFSNLEITRGLPDGW